MADDPQPLPSRRLKLWAIVIGAAMIAIVATVVVIIAMQGPTKTETHREAKQMPPGANTVAIEVRTKPRGEITVAGHKAGMSPITVHVPKGDKSVEIGANLVGHPLTKQVVPDRDQTIDFTYP